MKKVLSLVSVLSLALQLTAGSALAKPTTFTVDPNHSRVSFSIRHIFSKVPGIFTLKDATLTYDAEAPASASVRAEIDASSINTANAKRDGHLKSADFFDVEKYPTITFVSKEVKDLGQGKLQVVGDLTMHGVTKRVTLEASYLGSGPGPGGEVRVGFEATTRVNRKDFEILWNRALDQGGTLLGDDVDIRLDIEAIEQRVAEAKAGSAASKPADAKPAGGKPAEKASK